MCELAKGWTFRNSLFGVGSFAKFFFRCRDLSKLGQNKNVYDREHSIMLLSWLDQKKKRKYFQFEECVEK